MNRNRALRWFLFFVLLLAFSAAAYSQVAVGISVRIGPPALPVYAQPICPGPGYIWTPGYWAWDDDDGYYWVPGTWVVAPVGMLWTPGWWGWGGGFYVWHPGYWGPHVGFYGGINYGFGYTGVGFWGGEWRGERFYYNRSVTNVSVTNVTNVYNRTVIVNNTRNISYNGGHGGIEARPTREQEMWGRERHVAPLAMQSQHEHMAAQNRENFARENHGRPVIAATERPADFNSHSVVRARAAGGEYQPPAMSPREARVNPGMRNNNNPRSNEGFRSFTPPNRNGGGYPSNPRGNENRGNEMRANEARPNQPRSFEQPANQGRPNMDRQYNDRGGNVSTPRGNENRGNEMRPNEARPNQPRSFEQPANQGRPNMNRTNNPQPSHQPAMRESAPRENPHPQGPPRQGPPPQEHHKGH